MSHAIDILDNALRGDRGALSFLEQTSSIYVLDAATNPGHPTTYGWWNFLNDSLNEVERYESEGRHVVSPTSNLDGHVRLLGTISQRVARRGSSSDRRLVVTCLANASMSQMSLLANEEVGQSLVKNNDELRERTMGRIASIVFDHSFHRKNVSNNSIMMESYPPRSAFSDPVAMEQLCGVVAANTVSSGPEAIRHLISDWIVPSVDSLPHFAIVAIMSHIAVEAMGKGSPVGTHDMIKSLVPSVYHNILGPILIESLRESDDVAIEGGNGIEHRTAALALRSIESWCKVNSIGAVKLKSIYSSTNVNILEAIADALYSNSEIIIDAISDLIELLLQNDAREANVTLGISIAGSVMGMCLPPGVANQLQVAQQVTGENEKSRVAILSELVSAVGLQRFRFAERQANNDTAVCRCLARTAAKVLLESQDLVSNGTLQTSTDGVLDLLFKATSHPSVYVFGIAVEALAEVVKSNSELSSRLLPHLQGKAIVPMHLVNDVDGSFDDYINFRERVLTGGLIACYTGCSTFYLESCGSAIEEFCNATQSPHLPYQLEAALFCMIAVAGKASKARDKQVLCDQLRKMITALKNSAVATSLPLVTAKTCLFINKYAKYFVSCSTDNNAVFQQASELVISLFHEQKICQLVTDDEISPLSEACNALKELLCALPNQFSTPAAMKALEDAWKMPYTHQQTVITIQDREVLSSGLVSVILSLPMEQWLGSLDSLAQPILSCLSDLSNEADSTSKTGQQKSIIAPIMNRLSTEIRLLAAVVIYFIQTNVRKNCSGEERTKVVACHRDALISLLHKAWPGLTLISKKYCSDEAIASSVGQLLSNSLNFYESEDDLPLLLEITGLAKTALGVAKSNPLALAPFLAFMERLISMHGQKIEPSPISNNVTNDALQIMAKNLMLMSYAGVKNDTTQECLKAMFGTLAACARKCPLFLMSLSRDSQPVGEVIRSSIETVPVAMASNETDIALSSITFMKCLVSSMACVSLDALYEDQKEALSPVVENIKHSIQTDILSTAVTSTCIGMCPPEVLGPLTNLIQLILKFSHWPDIEASVSAGIDCGKFQMGNEAKSVAFDSFKKCTMSEHITANFSSMIRDIWSMHQTDDTGSIAGGEAVHGFIQKYKSS